MRFSIVKLNHKIMKIKSYFSTTFLLFSVFAFFSCEKQDITEVEGLKSNVYQVNDFNNSMEEMAIVYANALTNEAFRKALKDEVLKKFDGDYNVLHKTLQAQKLKNGESVSSILKSNLKSTNLKSANFIEEGYTEEYVGKIPPLQVAIPVNCEKWNTSNEVPLVVFIPDNYDEKTFDKVKAYKPDGSYIWISSKKEPDYPVVVISPSERVDLKGNLRKYEKFETNKYVEQSKLKSVSAIPNVPVVTALTHNGAYRLNLEWTSGDQLTNKVFEVWRQREGYAWSKIAENGYAENGYLDTNVSAGSKYYYKVRARNVDGSSQYSNTVGIHASARNSGDLCNTYSLYLTKAALNAIEDWISGAPEIRFRVIKGAPNSAEVIYTSELMEPSSRSDINGKWWNPSVQSFNWVPSILGTVLNFDWREEEWYSSIEVGLSGSFEDVFDIGTIKAGATIKINIQGGDAIGNRYIYYWDPKVTTYSIGGFSWKVK